MLLFWFLADKKTSNEIKTDEKSAKKTAKKESTTGRSRGRPRKKETNHGNSDGNFSKLNTKCNLLRPSFTPCIDDESGRDLKRIVYVKYINMMFCFFLQAMQSRQVQSSSFCRYVLDTATNVHFVFPRMLREELL